MALSLKPYIVLDIVLGLDHAVSAFHVCRACLLACLSVYLCVFFAENMEVRKLIIIGKLLLFATISNRQSDLKVAIGKCKSEVSLTLSIIGN